MGVCVCVSVKGQSVLMRNITTNMLFFTHIQPSNNAEAAERCPRRERDGERESKRETERDNVRERE